MSDHKEMEARHPGDCQIHILAGQIFDSYSESFLQDQVVIVCKSRGIILEVLPLRLWRSRTSRCPFSCDGSDNSDTDRDPDSSESYLTSELVYQVIDLSHLTLLPGFVDAHVHFFSQPCDEKLGILAEHQPRETIGPRTLRASIHASPTLMAGFTTVRDLGNGGFKGHCTTLRSLTSPLTNADKSAIAGLRYYSATRPIVSSRSKHRTILDSQVADGKAECMKAVLEQVEAGADWIKINADYLSYTPSSDPSSEITSAEFLPQFDNEELKAMIDLAHFKGAKVAVEANNPVVISLLLDLGPDSIEQASQIFTIGDSGQLEDLLRNKVIQKWANLQTRKPFFVPTLFRLCYQSSYDHISNELWKASKAVFEKILQVNAKLGKNGIPIACGSGASVFLQGENAGEAILMRFLGAPAASVLSWATLEGWRCVQGLPLMHDLEVPGTFDSETASPHPFFGAIKKGWAADLVGIQGVLDGDVNQFSEALRQGVKFVMKGGEVRKLIE